MQTSKGSILQKVLENNEVLNLIYIIIPKKAKNRKNYPETP